MMTIPSEMANVPLSFYPVFDAEQDTVIFVFDQEQWTLQVNAKKKNKQTKNNILNRFRLY